MVTSDRGADYSQGIRSYNLELTSIEPSQGIDLVALIGLGGAQPGPISISLFSNGQPAKDLFRTDGRMVLLENLAEFFIAQIPDFQKEITVEKTKPSREGFGQRKVQYIILFVYIGLAAIMGLVWAIWYSVRLLKKPGPLLKGQLGDPITALAHQKAI